jgi:hypothetical protein
MGLRQRFGCFFLAGGMAVFLLYAVPLWQAFRTQPETVPVEWIGIALAAAAAAWLGWKLFSGGRAASQKPPSLGARMISRWRASGNPGDDPDDDGK